MLSKIGMYMAIFGVLAIISGFFNYSPKLIFWIYNWGNGVAWIIKLALVIVRGSLYYVGNTQEAR